MPKLQTLIALDAADRVATIEAMGRIAWAQWLVRAVPPRHWRSHFGTGAPAYPANSPAGTDVATVRRIRLAVSRALRNMPGSPQCLPQALAARRMLERRGIPSQLYIGTMRDDAGVPRFHAWLKVDDEWVTGICDESRYTLFTNKGMQQA